VSPRALTPKLRWLILTSNRVRSLPDEIGNCSQLQKLMLAGNELTSLPESLARCRRLELIRLSANRLGTFPELLLELPRLSWLAYSGNPFTAEIEARAVAGSAVRDVPWADLQIDEILGQGASGIIHRGRFRDAENSDLPVAVKLFKGTMTSDGTPESELAASVAAGLHPNLIAVNGKVAGHPSGTNGLVMELIGPEFRNLAGPPSFESCTRDVYPADVQFSLSTALRMASSVGSLACHLHAHGIMHGDLYAHNTLHDGRGRVLLGDFGAASFYERDGAIAKRLEQIEVRAFGCLLEEIIERCVNVDDSAPAVALLEELRSACLSGVPADRPSFSELYRRLADAGESAHSIRPTAQ
jgi:serine/threonine protein kinase